MLKTRFNIKFFVGIAFIFIWIIPAQADIGAGIFVDKSYFTQNEDSLTVSISAFNDGASETVDVHIGFISQGGDIYEYPDWNTALKPWLSSYTLPGNFNLPSTELFTLPLTVPPGIYSAFIALTAPGSTTNIKSLEIVPIVVAPVAANSSSFGALSMSYWQTPGGISVDAGGAFIQSDIDLKQSLASYEGEQPPLDQCVLNEIPIDFGSIPTINFSTLDAGNSLQLSAATVGSTNLVKDPEAGSLGYTFYAAPEGEPTTGFYSGKSNYTFRGFGGPQVSSFAVSVQAPSPLNLTQPAPGISFLHNALNDLVLEWSGNNGIGTVDASISGSSLSKIYSIDCRFVDDGSASVPTALLVQLRDNLSDGGFGIPGFELPDGFEIPGFGATTTLEISRGQQAFFQTTQSDLTLGIANIEAGASVPMTLE
jgi:hypothetical protein